MTPAVKFLLIANTAVFVVQTLLGAVTDYQLTLDFGLVPPLVWHEFLYLAAFHLPVSPRRTVPSSLQYAGRSGCSAAIWSGVGAASFFCSIILFLSIGGGILNTLFVPDQMGPSIGASAGVYGILLAFGLIYPNQHRLFLFSLSDQDETLRLDHRRHRALFLASPPARAASPIWPTSAAWSSAIFICAAAIPGNASKTIATAAASPVSKAAFRFIPAAKMTGRRALKKLCLQIFECALAAASLEFFPRN